MNLLQLEQQLRYTRFVWDGKESNLHGARGLDAMPESLLKALINECAIEINADGRFDREIYHGSLESGKNYLQMPSNLLAVQRIVIFDEIDPRGTTTDAIIGEVNIGEFDIGGTTVTEAPEHEEANCAAEGSEESDVAIIGEVNIGEFDIGETQTTSATSTTIANHQMGEAVRLEGPVLSHELLIQGNTSLTGIPQKFMLMEQCGTLFAQFDREVDAAYLYDIYFLAAPATMASDSSTPDIATHYHNLYRALAAKKIAEFLGDDRSIVRHAASYENFLRKVKGLRYGSPARVRFQLFPGVNI